MTAPDETGRYQFAEPSNDCFLPRRIDPVRSRAIIETARAWYGDSPTINRRADGMHVCVFTHCEGHKDKLDVVIHALQELAADSVVIKRYLRTVITKEGTIMTSQEDVDAAVAAIGTAVADLGAQNVEIQDAQSKLDIEIQTLAAQVANGETVDTSALVAAGAALATATSALDATVGALVADPNVPAAPAPVDPGTGTLPDPNASAAE